MASAAQRPTSLGAKLEDFPLESLKGSVASLRSKFGSPNSTDTGQIFGVTRPVTVSRSKTFNTIAKNNNVHTQHLNNVTIAKSTGAIQRSFISTSPTEEAKANSKELIRNNRLRRQQFLETNSAPNTPSSPSTSHTPTANLDKLSNGVKSVNSERSHARNILLNAIPSSPVPSLTPSEPQTVRYETQAQLRSRPVNTVILRRNPDSTSNPRRVQSFVAVDSKASFRSPRPKSTALVQSSLVGVSNQEQRAICKTPEIEVTTRTEKSSDSTKFTSSVTLKMADPALVEKYSHVSNIEQLNIALKETKEFEERRAIRAAIRKLRDSNNNPASGRTTHSSRSEPNESSTIDLSGYTTEEDLKILLHQTSSYEDKKKIRSAIRDLRKKTAEQIENKSAGVRETTPTRNIASSLNKDHDAHTANTPPTPDAVSVLQDLSNGRAEKPNNLPDLCTNLHTSHTDDEVIVSPIKHESRTLHRADGDVQIESFSKHSRTTSQSEVYEKSTKVTKISKVGGLQISEQDEVITKEKLSAKGSVTSESDLRHKVDIKEAGGVGGTQIIEEDITMERKHSSVTTGENSVSNFQVSIVREKHPPRLVKALEDVSGVDGDPLKLVCEFESDDTADCDSIKITWLKDGVEIKPSNDISFDWSAPSASLTIQEMLYPDDNGIYICKARNKHGCVESSSYVTVTETPQPPTKMIFAEDLTDQTAKDGDTNVILKCKLAEKYSDVDISWYKSGKIMKNNSEFVQTFDGLEAKLVISEVFPEDSGEYECVAVRGNQESSSFCKLTVQNNPKIKITPASSKLTKTQLSEDQNNNQSVAEDSQDKSVSRCEEILKAATIEEDKVDSAAPVKSAEVKPAVSAEKKDSKPNDTKPSSALNNKDAAPFSKTSLKSVGRPTGGMNRPGADNTVESLIGKLSKPGTAGSVTVNQSWTSNVGGNRFQSQTNASKSWGKTGAMSALLGKGAPASSRGAMAAFKQMDTANNPNGAPKPNFARNLTASSAGGAGIQRSATAIKQLLLNWCKSKTQEYENVAITNFSTSWNNGLAFLALIHHFYPDSFDWSKVDERRRRENFQLAFDLAEKKADIAPLLDVEDMVRMKKPDWKCVFTYVQSFYRKLRDHENNKHTYMAQ